MPFTPFHFGPGALVHAAAHKHVSFIAFCVTNVIIDVETLYYILTRHPPLHRFLHTLVGAPFAIVATVLLFLACRWFATRFRMPNLFRWRELGVLAVTLGASIGAFSHVVLDGIMHADSRPFAPFSQSNPMLDAIEVSALHQYCVAAGVFALAVMMMRYLLKRWDRNGRL